MIILGYTQHVYAFRNIFYLCMNKKEYAIIANRYIKNQLRHEVSIVTQPLYQKIKTDLKNQIISGQRLSGSKLPTEKELSDSYHVSRITAKRALTDLEQDGFITRVQGSGSFVKEFIPKNAPRRILLVLPLEESTELSIAPLSEGVMTILQAEKIDVLLTNFDFLTHRNTRDITSEFDGLIYYARNEEAHLDLLVALALQNFPVIILDKKIHDLPFPAVTADNEVGGYLATKHLQQLGHKKIAYYFGTKSHPQSTRQRYFGYLRALSEEKLPFHTHLEDTYLSGESLSDYLRQNNVTALVCENDLFALRAIQQLRQQNWQIPAELSVTGFDDTPAARFFDPALTTILQDFKKIGNTAAKLLLSWLQDGKQPTDRKISVKLIQRNSTTALIGGNYES